MAKHAAREYNLTTGTTSVKEFNLPKTSVAKQIFSKRGVLNLFNEGLQELSFSRVNDVPPQKTAFAWEKGGVCKSNIFIENLGRHEKECG